MLNKLLEGVSLVVSQDGFSASFLVYDGLEIFNHILKDGWKKNAQ